MWVHIQRLITDKKILILGKGLTQGPEHTLFLEKLYSINFTENNKNSLFELAL